MLQITTTAELLSNRGVINQFMGYLGCAMKDYQQAIALDPGYALAYFNAANVYFFHRQFPQVGSALPRSRPRRWGRPEGGVGAGGRLRADEGEVRGQRQGNAACGGQATFLPHFLQLHTAGGGGVSIGERKPCFIRGVAGWGFGLPRCWASGGLLGVLRRLVGRVS